MNLEEDSNPFADPSIQQATAQTSTNPPTLNDYQPFNNVTVSAKPTPTAYQPPTYASVIPPIAAQDKTEKFNGNAARIDLTQLERQQAELDQREKRITERERELGSLHVGHTEKNFPPIPNWCPFRPCFYQDIRVEIPTEFQRWVRFLYYLWSFYSLTLALNMIAALSYFVVDTSEGKSTFGLSILYFILFVPCSYICWFRPIYRAFREDRASSFMVFFFVFFLQLIITILQFFGIGNLGCGLILMIHLFAAGGKKIAVGIIVMFVTLGFGIIAVTGGLLLIKVHRLYRQSGATFEQAQREFQSAFVNNPTVRGAAREVATAGINQNLHSGGFT